VTDSEILMELQEFRALMHISVSGEREHRRVDDDWPPHITIGQKVFYRRATVMEWLARKEAQTQEGVLT
jgi:hypothetical protein